MLRESDYKTLLEEIVILTITIYAVQQNFSSSKLLHCFCKLISSNWSAFSTSINLLREQASLVKIIIRNSKKKKTFDPTPHIKNFLYYFYVFTLDFRNTSQIHYDLI